MREQRTKNNIGLIGLAVVVMVSLVFYYLVNADSQNNRGNKTNKSHESSVNVEPLTPPTDVSDETSPSIDDTAISMSSGPAIDYGSLESVLAAYHQESQELLQAYQQYETDMDAIESRAKISLLRINCYTRYFDSQAELDRHISSRSLGEILGRGHEYHMTNMARCYALRNYLGHEEITNSSTELRGKSRGSRISSSRILNIELASASTMGISTPISPSKIAVKNALEGGKNS